MNLHNPFTKSLEPLDDGKRGGRPITIYVCGITPYDTTHLGHAFTYTSADILIRYLEYRGYAVKYVQNVTDIDDDILKRAAQTGDDWLALGNRWTSHFIEDMIALNVRPPDHYPRATEVIPEITDTVARLIERGVAYERNGSVYFDVNQWEGFGALSGYDKQTMLAIANERGNLPADPNKRDPLDFVLWQAAKPGEPVWDSPWGLGRPGWHIECSTMSSKFLGDAIDIHSGGSDLLFPHHCCEIAQMEPLSGATFVRFWMHTAMVRHEGAKMSKSLGNLVWARELLQAVSPDALRLYLASHHYAIEWSHDRGMLDWAGRAADRIRQAALVTSGAGAAFDPAAWETGFRAALDDNLNSPQAIGILDDLAVQTLLAAARGQNVSAAQLTLRTLSRVFGMTLDAGKPEDRVRLKWGQHLAKFQP
jgi:L-cysteine:1D-myo-inositol 2-amino-2-deoxy-alpha-D-glucopyranoside ligase